MRADARWGIMPEGWHYQTVLVGYIGARRAGASYFDSPFRFVEFVVDGLLACGVKPRKVYKYLWGWEYYEQG